MWVFGSVIVVVSPNFVGEPEVLVPIEIEFLQSSIFKAFQD